MCTSSHSYLQFERTFILSISSPCLILKPWGGYYHHHHGKRIFLPFGKLGRLLYYHKPKLLGSFFPKESTSYVISIKASFSLSKIIISKKLDQRIISDAKNYNLGENSTYIMHASLDNKVVVVLPFPTRWLTHRSNNGWTIHPSFLVKLSPKCQQIIDNNLLIDWFFM